MLETFDRPAIDPCCTAVGFYLGKCRSQVSLAERLVVQAVPHPAFHPFFKGDQHAIRPRRRFRKGPTAPNFSSLLSPREHCRWFCFLLIFHLAIHLPAPLRSIPITGLHCYYGRSDS